MIWIIAGLAVLVGVLLFVRHMDKKHGKTEQLIPVEIEGDAEMFTVPWYKEVKQRLALTKGERRRRWKHRRAGRTA